MKEIRGQIELHGTAYDCIANLIKNLEKENFTLKQILATGCGSSHDCLYPYYHIYDSLQSFFESADSDFIIECENSNQFTPDWSYTIFTLSNIVELCLVVETMSYCDNLPPIPYEASWILRFPEAVSMDNPNIVHIISVLRGIG